MDLGAELGAKIFVLWGGREGTETDACRRPDEAVKRLREAVNYLCEYSIDRKYGYRFALEAKPNEPRGDIYMATTGAYLGFIADARPSRAGRREPRSRRTSRWPGLNFLHAVGAGLGSGQAVSHRSERPGRPAATIRTSASAPRTCKPAFFLVKFLEDVGYDGPRHFDAHAYRTEDYDGVKDFARGCMRTYLILKDKAARWNADAEIQEIVKDLSKPSAIGPFSADGAAALKARSFDRAALASRGLQYERLDQLTTEVLLGVR